MANPTTTPDFGGPVGVPSTAEEVRSAGDLWWVWLLVGIAWILAALIILQFDSASVTTVGVLIGIMFVGAGAQQFVLAAVSDSLRWLSAIFGVLFWIAAIICFINPEDTFAGLADVLGFLFLVVGVWWFIRSFLERTENPLWWLGLIGAMAMVVLAFWTSGQFFITKSYTLLVFAGVWALMQGVTDIVRAFAVRSMRDVV
jgi:hypothetical protein